MKDNGKDVKAMMLEIQDLRAQVAALMDDAARKDRRIGKLERHADYRRHQISIIHSIAEDEPNGGDSIIDETDEPPFLHR